MEPTPNPLDSAQATEPQKPATNEPRSLATNLRVLASVLLVAVAVFAACSAVLAYWVDTVLLDTDTFMTAAEPIVRDQAVRDEAANAITAAAIEAIDAREIADSLPVGGETALVDDLVTGFETLVERTVSWAVDTEVFENLWLTEMRAWHVKLVGAVRAPEAEYSADGAEVRVALGPYVDLLAEQTENDLVQRLITALVPESVRQTQVVVFDGKLVENRLPLLRALDAARPYLAWIAAFALLLALIAAPNTALAAVGAGAALAVGGGVAWMAARAEASRIAALMQSNFSASEKSAVTFAETLFGPLETWLAYVALAGVLVSVIGAIVWYSRRQVAVSEPSKEADPLPTVE